ncbi:MAG TPA: hypothetical protein GXZ52_01725 [Clostridiales bacterium]|jgi:hypothetical protein|nr:hypothetical protein [Clostridiales bacterium]
MKKIWKVTLIVSLILFVSGCAIMGVATLTGGSFSRLYDTVFSELDIMARIDELIGYFSW